MSTETDWIACHECDLLQKPRELARHQRARCGRCGCSLYAERGDWLERAFTLSIASLLLLIVANAYPLLILEIEGRAQTATLLTGVTELYDEGEVALAAIVLMACIGAPLIEIVGTIAVLGLLRRGSRPRWLGELYRVLNSVGPWGMIEVYLLGVLVALVKLADMAKVDFGVSFYAFLALILTHTATSAAMDSHHVWDRIGRASA